MLRKPFTRVVPLAALALLVVSTSSARAFPHHDEAVLVDACEVIDALTALHFKGIPPALMHDAQGIAIIPKVIKAGFVIGGRHGRGVMLVRGPGDSWNRPVFVTITGGSIGWQAGIESTDLVLVFKTRAGVERIMKGKGKLTLGADVSVAAGPVGRQAEAATDAQLKAEIFSYSRSRGLFAGLSLEGAALLVDHRGTDAYYKAPRVGPMPLTPPEAALQMRLSQLSMRMEPPMVVPGPVPVPPGPYPPPPPPVVPGPIQRQPSLPY